MKYMLHTCSSRNWYVRDFLIPSMTEQGIDLYDIYVWYDDGSMGNLTSWLKSCEYIRDNLMQEEGIWHLQDDVLICRDFKEKTESHNTNLVGIGFRNTDFNVKKSKLVGLQPMTKIPNSFPCIYLPNRYIPPFIEWFYKVTGEGQYKEYYETNKHDDFFTTEYLYWNHPNEQCYNYEPCLVDHISYLIGGSTLYDRKKTYRAISFKDQNLVEELERRINGSRKNV